MSGHFHRIADGGAAPVCGRRRQEGGGEIVGAFCILDDAPIHHDVVEGTAGIIQIGDGDAAQEARPDCLDQPLTAKRGGNPLALELGLLPVDAVGDIGGDDKFQIHRFRGGHGHR